MSHAETAHHNALMLPYPPSGNRYWRHAKGRTYLSSEARAYRAAVARIAPMLPLDGPVSVTLTVYRPRKAGDLDNTFKVLLDALNGLAWHDDSQIVELHGYRHEDKENPRVEVEVKRLSVPTRGTYGKVPPGAKRKADPRREEKACAEVQRRYSSLGTEVMREMMKPPGEENYEAALARSKAAIHDDGPQRCPDGFKGCYGDEDCIHPPRSKGLDASALAAETFAPPPLTCSKCGAQVRAMDSGLCSACTLLRLASCLCTREQPCAACSRVGP